MARILVMTDDGVDLSAEYAPGAPPSGAAAVLLHPHPLMGGDMHSSVTEHLFAELPQHGIDVLRFDFRGAGGSGGEHGGGTAEAADVRAAVSELDRRSGHGPWLVGWSFGADVSLRVDHDAVAGWVAIAPTFRTLPGTPAAATDDRPVTLVVPEHDQFAPPRVARAATRGWYHTTVTVVPGVDHFLTGRLDVVEDAVRRRLLRSAER